MGSRGPGSGKVVLEGPSVELKELSCRLGPVGQVLFDVGRLPAGLPVKGADFERTHCFQKHAVFSSNFRGKI